MKSLAEARIKRTRAVELASQGMSYAEIAQAVGYAHRGSAHRAVWKAINEREFDDVETYRHLENERLDDLLRAVWPAVERGDLEAINTALRITAARTRLLGLDGGAARPLGHQSLVVGGPAVF